MLTLGQDTKWLMNSEGVLTQHGRSLAKSVPDGFDGEDIGNYKRIIIKLISRVASINCPHIVE